MDRWERRARKLEAKRRKMKKRYVASKRHTIQVDYDD